MLFGFNVHTTENDYIDLLSCSERINPTAKKQKILLRLIALFIFIIPLIPIAADYGLFQAAVVLGIPAALVQIFFNKLYGLVQKGGFKVYSASDDSLINGYSIEFYENSLKVFTRFSREEYLYSGFKNVCIYKNRAAYFFISEAKAYCVHSSAFTSPEHFNAFKAFVLGKFPNAALVD